MAGLSIERMRPDGWERVRAIRLRALADTPDAFGMTLAEEEAKPTEEWRTRLANAGNATFVATVDGRDVGLVIGSAYRDRAGAAGLFGMWVAPEARGRGIAGALVDAIVRWARERGFARVLLDVADGNDPAIRLYASKGFAPNGATGSLPAPRQHVLEHQRELLL